MLCPSFTEQEQLKQLKHKQMPLQVRLATLTHDSLIKKVHYLVIYETLLHLQKDDYHSISDDFGKDQIAICNNIEGEKSLINH